MFASDFKGMLLSKKFHYAGFCPLGFPTFGWALRNVLISWPWPKGPLFLGCFSVLCFPRNSVFQSNVLYPGIKGSTNLMKLSQCLWQLHWVEFRPLSGFSPFLGQEGLWKWAKSSADYFIGPYESMSGRCQEESGFRSNFPFKVPG